MSTDWRVEYQARRARDAAALHALRDACVLLRRLGVRTVRLNYDGEQYAGSLYGVSFTPEPAAGVPDGIPEVITSAAYWLLPPGWEIDAGSSGTLTIDVRSHKVHRDHRRRLLSLDVRSEELDL